MDTDDDMTSKEAVKAFFKECGGHKVVAHALDVSLARVYSFTDEAFPEHNVSLKRVAQLTTPKSPGMARYLAHLAGGVFCPLPTVDRRGTTMVRIAESARSHGEAISEAVKAIADGEITEEERTVVGKEIAEAICDLVALQKSLEPEGK